MSKDDRILLAGGGSGGHAYPLLAVAEEIQKAGSQVNLEFIGDGGILREEAASLGIKFRQVMSPKWRRYFSFLNFADIFKFPVGFLQSLFYVWLYMPDLVFAKGSYASFLPALTAKLMFIPLIVHESDSVPGFANRLLGIFSEKVFLALEGARNYFSPAKAEVVGNPIRPGILGGGDRVAAVKAFQLDPAKPVVLITGASQGAKAFNDVLLLSIVELVENFQVIHQTGPKNFDEVSRRVSQVIQEGKDSYGPKVEANYRIYPAFGLQEMALAYAAGDIIVSRAGSQIFETAALAKPAVIIPLKNSSRGHQLTNAREFARFGATVIEEDNLKPHIFVNEIKRAYENRTALSAKISQFARPVRDSLDSKPGDIITGISNGAGPDAARIIAQSLLTALITS